MEKKPVFLSDIGLLVPIRLNGTNFVAWRFLITTILSAYELQGFVDGSRKRPGDDETESSEFDSSDDCKPQPKESAGDPKESAGDPNPKKEYTDDPNPKSESEADAEYVFWLKQDKAIMTMIMATLSPSLLGWVTKCTTSRDMWEVVESKCGQLSEFNIRFLRSQIENIKKAKYPISVYVMKIEEMRDNLAALGYQITDEEVMKHALRGLPDEFNEFKKSVKPGETPLEEFYLDLLEAEKKAEKILKIPMYMYN